MYKPTRNHPGTVTVVSQKKTDQKYVSPATYPSSRCRRRGRFASSPENQTAAIKGVSAIQQSHAWSNGAKQARNISPLAIAASHGQNRSARFQFTAR
jgi:hypothetical protein